MAMIVFFFGTLYFLTCGGFSAFKANDAPIDIPLLSDDSLQKKGSSVSNDSSSYNNGKKGKGKIELVLINYLVEHEQSLDPDSKRQSGEDNKHNNRYNDVTHVEFRDEEGANDGNNRNNGTNLSVGVRIN